MKFSVFAFAVLALVCSVQTKEFPKYIKPCSRKGDINKCLAENFELCRPHLAKGIPRLSIPSLSPLIVTGLALNTPNLQLKVNDLNLFQLEKFVIKKIDAKIEPLEITIDLNFPIMDGFSDYGIKGKLLLFQLDGHGKMEGNMTNIDCHVVVKGTPKPDGTTDISIEKLQLQVTTGYLYFNKLFGDNEELTVNTNKVINENFREFVEEVKPVVEQTVGGILINTIKGLFGKFKLDELFPQD